MKFQKIRALLICCLLVSAPVAACAEPDEAKDKINAALSAILQGNGKLARKLLNEIPDGALDEKNATARSCMISRLDGPPVESDTGDASSGDIFIQNVLDRFRLYWRDAVSIPDERETVEVALQDDLVELLHPDEHIEREDILNAVQAEIITSGKFALLGRTGLLLDILLWERQEEVDEKVTLPDGPINTKVFYLHDFRSEGWANYLSCNNAGTGGWATTDGLYVIVARYKSLTDENFRVSFLAHESQHFSDYKRFPGLQGWELEYRAKLVELIYADTTREKILSRFLGNQGDNTADAHSYANRKVVTDLRDRLELSAADDLKSVAPDDLRRAALNAFNDDTRMLLSRHQD